MDPVNIMDPNISAIRWRKNLVIVIKCILFNVLVQYLVSITKHNNSN